MIVLAKGELEAHKVREWRIQAKGRRYKIGEIVDSMGNQTTRDKENKDKPSGLQAYGTVIKRKTRHDDPPYIVVKPLAWEI